MCDFIVEPKPGETRCCMRKPRFKVALANRNMGGRMLTCELCSHHMLDVLRRNAWHSVFDLKTKRDVSPGLQSLSTYVKAPLGLSPERPEEYRKR